MLDVQDIVELPYPDTKVTDKLCVGFLFLHMNS